MIAVWGTEFQTQFKNSAHDVSQTYQKEKHMVNVIIDGWAYRIRQDGMFESAKVSGKNVVPLPDSEDWGVRRPELTELEQGEAWYLREGLKNMTLHFPAGRKPPVKHEETREAVSVGSDLR